MSIIPLVTILFAGISILRVIMKVRKNTNTDVYYEKFQYCYVQVANKYPPTVVVSLFSWRYNPLWLYFHSPVAGFRVLVLEVS
jgi:hypothetical protein